MRRSPLARPGRAWLEHRRARGRRRLHVATSSTIQIVSANVGGKNVFIPSTIVVIVAGKPVTLSIFNTTDVPHGFAIPGLEHRRRCCRRRQEHEVKLPALEGEQDLRHQLPAAPGAPHRDAGGAARGEVARARRSSQRRAAARPAAGCRTRARACRRRGGSVTQRPPASGTRIWVARRVPEVERQVDHRVDAAADHLRVAEGVGVAAQHRDLARHALEGGAQRRRASKQKRSPCETIARRRSLSCETRTGAPLRRTPPPFQPTVRSPSAGRSIRPSTGSPSSSSAISVEKSGMPREKRDRAVDRVDHPARPRRAPPSAPYSSPRIAELRERLAQRRADRALGRAIRLGDGRAVALGLDRDARGSAAGSRRARGRRRASAARARVFESEAAARRRSGSASRRGSAPARSPSSRRRAERVDARVVAVAPVDLDRVAADAAGCAAGARRRARSPDRASPAPLHSSTQRAQRAGEAQRAHVEDALAPSAQRIASSRGPLLRDARSA